jgi:hypothetical protein
MAQSIWHSSIGMSQFDCRANFKREHENVNAVAAAFLFPDTWQLLWLSQAKFAGIKKC